MNKVYTGNLGSLRIIYFLNTNSNFSSCWPEKVTFWGNVPLSDLGCVKGNL